MREAADALAAQAVDMADDAFVVECREFTRAWNTLPQPLAGLRKDALRRIRSEAAANGVVMRFIAQRLRIDPNRLSKLTRPAVAS